MALAVAFSGLHSWALADGPKTPTAAGKPPGHAADSAKPAPPSAKSDPVPGKPADAKPADPRDEEYRRDIVPLLGRYCARSHHPLSAKGGVDLSKYPNVSAITKDREVWQHLADRVREGSMPPARAKPLSQEQRDHLVKWVETTLHAADAARTVRDPGRKVIHRLNRVEYNLTIRDLTGVDTRPADRFPADGGGGAGFDNHADALYLPPILMEGYLAAGKEVMDRADLRRVFPHPPAAGEPPTSTLRKNLAEFLPRAFRRPVTDAEVSRYLAVAERALGRGDSVDSALRLAARAILVSPHFLFRIERDRPGTIAWAVPDGELANRLSYFLWSSMPDDRLRQLAAKGELSKPETYRAEVRRLIADPKFRAFAENFTGQWLGVRALSTTHKPDAGKFPEYTPSLRDAMIAEPILFVESAVRENRPVADLLAARDTMLNEELARFYGVPNVTGPEFRKVALSEPKRGGVITMAGVLTLTSYPRRTSPVLRGKWILEEILGAPPPPPPPVTPGLDEEERPRDGKTFRQRLEAHRSKAECASCHARIDPLGFGLENFDPIGRWRTKVGDGPVDAAGQLVSGEKFTGPAELKTLLVARRADFARHLSEKMLAYALARSLGPDDRLAARELAAGLASKDHRLGDILIAITESYPFRHRRGVAEGKKP
jgi:hypothetical protein